MAELSSLLFVQTDELNRPTLIASNDTDNLTSSLMPQDVKDTVFIVSSSKVSSNYTAWDSVSAVSGLQELSGVSADVSVIGEISGVIYDGSDGWNSVSTVSGLSALRDVSADISAVPEISSIMYDNSTAWNSVSAVSGLQELSSVSGDISAVSGLSALLFDGSTALSVLSGSIPGNNGGPDVPLFSALDHVARVVRVVRTPTGPGDTLGYQDFDPDDTDADPIVQVSGVNSIRSPIGKVLALGALDPSGNQVASVKLDWVETESVGVSYLSGGVVGLVGVDDIRIGTTNLDLLPTGASSIKGLYTKTKDSSGNWDGAYDYLDGPNGVSGSLTYFIDTSGDLAFKNTVDTSNIDANAITNNEIADDAVTERTLIQNAVTTDKIAPDAVTEAKILDGSITTGKLNDGAITSEKIGAGEVTETDIAARAVTETRIALSAITTPLIQYGAIKQQQIDANAVIEEKISGSAITTAKIADQAITQAKIQAGAVTTEELAAGGVDASNIADNTITAEQIAENSIGPSELEDTAVTASSYDNANITVDAQGRITFAETGTGGGGGGVGDASALLIGEGNYASIDDTADQGQILVYNGTNFVYRTQAFSVDPTPGGFEFTAPSGDVTYNFGPSASIAGGETLDFSGSFTSSGATKTLLEFDDKSRVALGRNSVPLEISALGESDVRLEDDGTSGAFVLLKGSTPSEGQPSRTRMHFQHADLSADSDSQIDFDTDINMGGSAHLVGNMIGANHIACQNKHGSTLTAGTPVYIKGFVGSGAAGKIEIGAASASVASAMPAIGVLSEDLDNNIEGYVDAFGVADNIDTQTPGFALQDTLYVAPTGGLTNVRPTATSDLVQNIGIVERVDSSNGKIIVLGPGRTNDVPNSPTKLLSTNYTGTGNVPTSLTTVDWASPTLNNGSITYSAGEFTIPAAMAGDYLEFNIQLGTDTGITPGRIKLEMELQKDTGSGYTTEAAAADYVVRNDSIDRGSISISGYIDPAAVSSGDKYRVQVLQVAEGNAGQFWPDACKISIKSHRP